MAVLNEENDTITFFVTFLYLSSLATFKNFAKIEKEIDSAAVSKSHYWIYLDYLIPFGIDLHNFINI